VASSEEARSAHGAAVTRRTALEADLQAARDQLAAAQAALPAAEEA